METAPVRSTVLKAVGWSAVTRLFGQLLNWVYTLLIVRFLQPTDYGLMGLAMAATGFFQAISYVGVSDAVVQSQSIDEEDLRSVFGFVILINSTLAVLLCALAWPVAAFYRDPRLISLIQLASLVFVFITLQAIPSALLEKRLDLKRISRVEVAANAVAGLTGLTLAWAGYGVWSLMIMMLTVHGLRAIGLWWVEPYWRMPSFRFRGCIHILKNGLVRTAENALWYLCASSDVLIIGRLLGPAPLGIYSVARQIGQIPAQKLALVVRPAAFPAFAMVQHDRVKAQHYLSKAMRLIALASFPVFFGISAIAPQIVEIFLGPRWTNAVLPLRLLAAGMALNSVASILTPFLTGLGQFRASFRNTLFTAILFPLAFAMGSPWGIDGVCVAATVAYPLQFLVLTRRCAISIETDAGTLLRPLVRPFLGALVMYGCVLGIQVLLPRVPLGFATAVLITAGATIYCVFCLIFCRPIVQEFFDLAR
jgi:teichuronic acid exporter